MQAPFYIAGVALTLTFTSAACAENLGVTNDPGLKVRSCGVSPDACRNGYVWRGATSTDHVCVTPKVRSIVEAENAHPDAHRTRGGGDFGEDMCKPGFVWRGTTSRDHICVSTHRRELVAHENALAQNRRACR